MQQRCFIRLRSVRSLVGMRLCALLILLVALLGTFPRPASAAPVVVTTIPVQSNPFGVGVNASTNRVYVANLSSNSVSVIDGATNTALNYVPVGRGPFGLAVNSTTNRIYVANDESRTVSVIDGATNNVTATVP